MTFVEFAYMYKFFRDSEYSVWIIENTSFFKPLVWVLFLLKELTELLYIRLWNPFF